MNWPKVLLICIDGCSPEYLKKTETPNLDKIKSQGFYLEGKALIPTVTNLNNVSIITGVYPAKHGIVANFYLDPKTKKGIYLESSKKILAPTIFEKISKKDGKSALFTTKAKLAHLLKKRADFVCSVESPPLEMKNKFGVPPGIYSLEATDWLLRAAELAIGKNKFDFTFIATSDYIMHKYKPEDEQSKEHIRIIDKFVGGILEGYPAMNLFITADHGMNEKTKAIDLEKLLEQAGIKSIAIPIIKDRYVIHHQNMGGAAYIYLEDKDLKKAVSVLKKTKGIEEIFSKEKAVEKFHLYPGRIGNLFVLADKKTVFGKLGVKRKRVKLRSHGSRYEQKVPIIGWGELAKKEGIRENKDIVKNIF